MNKISNLSCVRSSDLIDAKLEEHQLCGSKQCPGCGHKFEGKPVREKKKKLNISNILAFNKKPLTI